VALQAVVVQAVVVQAVVAQEVAAQEVAVQLEAVAGAVVQVVAGPLQPELAEEAVAG
jgi:hypothetical protein